MHFWRYYVSSIHQNWEFIWIIPNVGVIFGQNLVIWPPGVPIKEVKLKSSVINFKGKHSRFILNAFLRLICITNWPWLRVYLQYTHFWGHFFKIWKFDPRVPTNEVTIKFFCNQFQKKIFKTRPQCFLRLICITYWPKLHYANFWGQFWPKFGNLTPRGGHKWGFTYLFLQ